MKSIIPLVDKVIFYQFYLIYYITRLIKLRSFITFMYLIFYRAVYIIQCNRATSKAAV